MTVAEPIKGIGGDPSDADETVIFEVVEWRMGKRRGRQADRKGKDNAADLIESRARHEPPEVRVEVHKVTKTNVPASPDKRNNVAF